MFTRFEQKKLIKEANEITHKSDNKELVTNCDRSAMIPIESRILTIRGKQVMVDRDLAELYQVDTKRLNEQVKRNVGRFPKFFRFQLNNEEKDRLVANCDRFTTIKHSSSNPFVSTEIFQRMEWLEMKQLQTDEKVDAILDKLNGNPKVKEGVFFGGQIFDAYALVADLFRRAEKRIVIIDNFIDDTVLVQLSKRNPGVKVDIYDGLVSRQLRQDVEKHNEQFPGVTLHKIDEAHDRFVIIDEDVYHIGASLKDLGKKLFAFSRLEVLTGTQLLESMPKKL